MHAFDFCHLLIVVIKYYEPLFVDILNNVL